MSARGGVALVVFLAACEGPSPGAVEASAPARMPELMAEASKDFDPLARLRDPPAGFADLRSAVPGIHLEIRYHTAENFTGAPLPGYGAPGAWLRERPAQALARVQADLAEQGLSLLVYDAYRPVRATLAMVAWAERNGRIDVLDDGYVARRSGHNRGDTIDLTLVDATSAVPLEMGTPWDTFSNDSHSNNASGAALVNRSRLAAAMMAQGWRPYAKEWWHFSWSSERPPRSRDVPYGCFEAEEGRWTPPGGWSEPGFVMPSAWPSQSEVACG